MNDIDRRVLLGAAGIAGVAAAAGYARGGPLSPPAGPVSSTGRTLTESEPRTPVGPATTPGDAGSLYRITQPGSYYLTGNVQGVAGKHGIVIAASDVTLDLMGFELRGTYSGSGPGGSSYGVQVAAFAGFRRATVRNGTVSFWDSVGVGMASDGCLVENVTAVSCPLVGIGVGYGSTYMNCSTLSCASGFNISPSSALINCHAQESSSQGFILNQACVLEGCTARSSGSHGFRVQGNSLLRGCAAYQSGGHGFQLDSHSAVNQCVAYFNALSGINANGSSSIIDCTCNSNGQHGILAGTACLVRGNSCDGNGTAGTGYGVSVTGSRNRIEANHCTGNDQGINVSGAGNLIIRNSVSGNGGFGYAIAANNSFGPNVVPAGNQIASSNNPHSNYEF